MLFTPEFNKSLIDKLSKTHLVYENSLHVKNDRLFLICRKNAKKFLAEASPVKEFILNNQKKEIIELAFDNNRAYLALFALTIENSKRLLDIFHDLQPKQMDKKTSVGFGDRIGIASPAHVRISKEYDFFPLFAQQSAREITKTSRDCETVLHNAFTGVFQEGYKNSWGTDADHIAEEKWLRIMLDNTYCPYTMFTIDTYNYINASDSSNDSIIDRDDSFKERLKKSQKYIGRKANFAGKTLKFTKDNLNTLVRRYYRSLDYLLNCYNLIKSKISDFDFEPTFDEREIDTAPLDHFYLASEMINDGISFSTIAPKFPGLFEKGIDYIGNLNDFVSDLKVHSAIAQYFGNYRLSFHSADDKFMTFKYFREILGDNFHVKTSGTTWMESLRTIAFFNPSLFKKIIDIVLQYAEENSKAYYITLDLKKINDLLRTSDLIELIDIKETRQFLHVSYGTVITEYRNEIIETLYDNEEAYYKNVINNYRTHFKAIFGK